MKLPILPSKTKTYRSINAKISDWVSKNSFLYIDNSRWYSGITNNEERRKIEHKIKNQADIKCWKCWDAKTKRIASALEDSLHRRGFSNAPFSRGAKETSKFIYVYKKFPTGLEK